MANVVENGEANPLQVLTQAISAPPDSPEQAELLGQLRVILEAQPGAIPILCSTLLSNVSNNTEETLLKRWLLDLLQFAICGTALGFEARTQLAMDVLPSLLTLLYEKNAYTVKTVIQCFASVYPLIFRVSCQDRQLQKQWESVMAAKDRIIKLFESPSAPLGVKVAAIKFMQRAILVQGRGVSDPRNINDPNLALVPPNHAFINVPALENEAHQLLEKIMSTLFSSKVVEILSAIINCFDAFLRLRPPLGELIIRALESWTPAALADQTPSAIRSVEKSIRILLNHLSRSPHGAPFIVKINETLQRQAVRMDQAAREERARVEERARHHALEASRKRGPLAPPDDEAAAKRLKVEDGAVTSGPVTVPDLSSLDVSGLPASMVIDLILANLLLIPDQTLLAAIETFRSGSATVTRGAPATSTEPVVGGSAAPAEEEPEDEDEDMEYEPDKLNEQLSLDLPAVTADGIRKEITMDADEDNLLSLRLVDFKFPLPPPSSEAARTKIMESVLSRLWDTGRELGKVDQPVPDLDVKKAVSGIPSSEMWVLLLVRIVTRGAGASIKEDELVDGEVEDTKQRSTLNANRPNEIRAKLCGFVVADLTNRLRFANVWLNEEWHNDRRQLQEDPAWPKNYHRWLRRLLDEHHSRADSKDKALTRFVLDLPEVPNDVFEMLREYCLVEERTAMGFGTLRDIVTSRPPLRKQALQILFDLTTHPARLTRTAAINTVRRWVPDVVPMDSYVRAFALQMLRRLRSFKPEQNGVDTVDTKMEPEEERREPTPLDEEPVLSYVPAELVPPVEKSIVQQHLELFFVMCTKVPELLDELFATYGYMDASVQESIQDLITALVRSLGQTNGKLLTLLRTFPSGTETLVLRILTILTEKQRPAAPLVALVKAVVAERNLDARFLTPIMAEMDKNDILRYLPRIVSGLTGQATEKALVRSVFSSIITAPPQTFAVSSNLPRVRQSELLTPVELMVLLHTSEKEIGIKQTIEAIQICFQMTDVYRSDVLAAVIQQLVDEPTLPTLFMRTVIMTVQKYKTLTGFVSTTILSRLIPKKVWENPALWDGFIRCAKIIAPQSYGVLLQLPKAQLREVINKDADLKTGLKDFMSKKPGSKARMVEIFGEDEETTPASTPIPSEA